MNKEKMKDLCMDRGKYPFVIPGTYGEGIKGKKYYTAPAQKPREITFEITTFRGMCWDAIHYYGKLHEIFSPPIKEIDGDPRLSHHGYLGEDTDLFNDIRVQINLWREVTEEERVKNPERYEDLDSTSGWIDKDKLIAFGKEVFAARFTGDWVLKIKDYTH